MKNSCPICFLEYTISDLHRVSALKCGHCFGYSCILKWMSLKKLSSCPLCFASCKKKEIRILYLSTENLEPIIEEEITKKYLREIENKKVLEQKILELENENRILKYERITKPAEENFELHTKLNKTIKIRFIPVNSLICYDLITDIILITSTSYNKYGIHKYSLSDPSFYSFKKFYNRITDMVISPFKDSLCLVAVCKSIFLFNIANDMTVFEYEFNQTVTAISFDCNSRNFLYVGDSQGNFFTVDIFLKNISQKNMSKYPIQNISSSLDVVYISSLFDANVFIRSKNKIEKVYFKKKSRTSSEENEIEIKYNKEYHIDGLSDENICTNIDSFNGNCVFTFRTKTFVIQQAFLANENMMNFFPDIKQNLKHRSQIIGNHQFLIDDFKNTINVYHLETFKCVHVYRFPEKIVNYDVSNNVLIVLTLKSMYYYLHNA